MEYPWKTFASAAWTINSCPGNHRNNIAWHWIPAMNRLPKRTRGWWEACHSNMAHNTNDPNANPYQPGRVAILSLNKSAHQVSSWGQDLGKLGRLCWTTSHSKNNHTLCIIAWYWPSSSNNGHLSVTQQYWQAFKGNKEGTTTHTHNFGTTSNHS